MIPLEQIRVASPCHADWDEMTGTAQARFCQSCRKNVYNLSEMTRAQAEVLISEKEGHLCVRFYTRADGTVLTQDCPVGLRAVRVKLARKLSYAAALLLSCGAGLLRWTGTAQAVTVVKPHVTSVKPPKPASPGATMGSPPAFLPTHTMGKPAPPPKPTPGRTIRKPAVPRIKPVDPTVGPDPFSIPGAKTDQNGCWVAGGMTPVTIPLPPSANGKGVSR